MKPTVLVYSTDADFLLVFGHILTAAGLHPKPVNDVGQIERVRSPQLIALVMDCQKHDRGAVKLCTRVKESRPNLPVVGLIAPNADALHVGLLAAGMDESFARPFAPEKLLAWLEVKAGKGPRTHETESGDLVHGELRLQRGSRRLLFKGKQITLPPIEFRMLRHLMDDPGTVFSREALIKAAWPADGDDADIRAVDVHVARLRKRLSTAIGKDVIRTVRSSGYAFAPDW